MRDFARGVRVSRASASRSAWAAVFIVATFLLSGSELEAQAAPVAPAPAPATGSALSGGEPAVEKAPDAPTEEQWLHAEDGRAYRLEKLDKKAVQWQKVSPTRFRTAWGPIEVDREDEQYLYYRVYRDEGQPSKPSPDEDRKQRAAEVRRLLPPPLAESDRLQGVDFGRGLPTTGQWRNGFEFADMNEDGKLDLVHGPARKGDRRPKIFLGNGKGDWRNWTEASFPRQTYEYGDVSVGDFNGDHHLDLFFGAHLMGLQALVGDGKGGFTSADSGLPWRTLPSEPLGFSSQQVQVVNWEGKTPEVLALSEGPKMSISAGAPAIEESSLGVRLYRNVSKDRKKVIWSWVNADDKPTNLFGEDLQLTPGRQSRGFLVGSGNMSAKNLLFTGRGPDGWLQEALPLPRQSYYWSLAPLRRAGKATFDVVGAGFSTDAGLELELIALYRRDASGWSRKTIWFAEQKAQGPIRVGTGDLDGNGL